MTRSMTLPRMGLAAALAGAIALAGVVTGHAQTGLPSGKENTIVLVQNAGNANADIAMDVYTPAGEAVPNASRNRRGVAPGGTAQFQQVFNEDLGEGFRGVGVLSSDQPIDALLVRDIRVGSHLSYSLANATGEGGHELAAPQLLNQVTPGRWWNSRVSLVNVGTQPACVLPTYTLLDQDGVGVGTVTHNGPGGANCPNGFVVDAGAQLTFSPESGDINFPAQTQGSRMAGYFEVTNPSPNNKIAAVVDLYRSDGNRLLGGYNALQPDDFGTEVNAPIALNTVSGWYTIISVMNLEQGTPNNVQIEYIGRLNDGAGASFTHTVNLGQVTHSGFHSAPLDASIPTGFVGYARVTADSPVAVTVVRAKQGEASYAAVNGVAVEQATTKWRSPLYFRNFAPGQAPSLGYNSWVQIQVADRSTANVTLRYVGNPDSGCPIGPYTLNTTVTDTQIFYAFRDASPGNGFPAGNAPHCFQGGLEVEANKDIIVITQVGADKFVNSDSEGVTNAFPAD